MAWTKVRAGVYTAKIDGHDIRIEKLDATTKDYVDGYRWVTHVDRRPDCGLAESLTRAKQDVPHSIRSAAQRG